MANYYDTRNNRHHKTEFICVERHAERGSGPADRNQAYVYPTEVACGDLPCPPYTGNRELSCVVCSPTESTGPGQVYVRWGKQACPSNRTTVKLYDGRTAVSDPGHWGGASNPLCLPMQPSYFQHNDKHQYATLIYGAAYETSSGPPYAEGLQAVDNGRIPCSVCFTPDIHGHVLVPGRIECPNNFISEYYGYLFSAHRACCSTNYICVDHEPETIGVESGGKMLYTVEIECGSILCQNEKTGYVGNREATCVLCVSDTKRRTAVYTAWGAIDCPGKNSSSREVRCSNRPNRYICIFEGVLYCAVFRYSVALSLVHLAATSAAATISFACTLKHSTWTMTIGNMVTLYCTDTNTKPLDCEVNLLQLPTERLVKLTLAGLVCC